MSNKLIDYVFKESDIKYPEAGTTYTYPYAPIEKANKIKLDNKTIDTNVHQEEK